MENKVEAQFTSKRSHVGFLLSLGLGHVTPFFELAKILVTNHGFHVTFFNITTEVSSAQNNLLHSPNFPLHFDIVNLPTIDISNLVNSETPGIIHLCINTNKRCCSQCNILVFTFFTASARLLALSLFLPQLDRDVEGEFVDLLHSVQVPDYEPNRKIDEYKWYFYHVFLGILLNTWEDLEPVTLRALQEHAFYHNIPIPPVHPIGPVIKKTEPMGQTGSECIAWLNQQPSNSVLFVTFGSGGTLTIKQQNELAWGLELSGQRFLWVVRAPSNGSASASFFNAGYNDGNNVGSYLPKGFVEKTQGRCKLVTSWAPQVEILRHPAMAAFLTHCGWNSLLESVTNGVPMIAWPLYAEQRMNAMMVDEEIGVGVKVKVGEGALVPREEVERVAKMVMVNGSSYHSRLAFAKLWKHQF
ncbi:hypothetical protein AAHE18_06G260900 [Arachis hypogaea]